MLTLIIQDDLHILFYLILNDIQAPGFETSFF